VPAGQVEVINGGSGTDTVIFSFDPGTVTPPNFTVTDPVTKGTYKFVLVEKVEISLCGNGHVDPGEQCDDGNRVSGDGCSATCQNECASDAQCPPAQDPCTTASCSTGACTQNPPTGFPGASCVVRQLSANLPCPGVNINQKLNLSEKVKRITGWLQRASGAKNPNPLLKQSAKLLSQAAAQASRLAKNGRITAACATDAQGRVDEAEVLVNSLRTN
jgi:cysteine-rich repeat protein